MEICNISTIICQRLLMELYPKGRLIDTSQGKAGTGYSLKTVKNVKIALQSCLQKAEDEELISGNPVKGVKLPKLQKKEMKTLKVNELSAFLNETILSDCYEFYFLEITTGLRLGEILALEWEDLDEEHKTISHILGHTDAGFTMNTYMHVTDSMQQNVADTMGNLLVSKKDEKDKKIVKFPA